MCVPSPLGTISLPPGTMHSHCWLNILAAEASWFLILSVHKLITISHSRVASQTVWHRLPWPSEPKDSQGTKKENGAKMKSIKIPWECLQWMLKHEERESASRQLRCFEECGKPFQLSQLVETPRVKENNGLGKYLTSLNLIVKVPLILNVSVFRLKWICSL